jgi:dTDP-4-dehydrorhamnose reductase
MNSVLDCRKIREAFGISARPWQTSLQEVLDELLS